MKIDTTILLPVAAVIASLLLLVAGRKRLLEAIALVASGAWLLHALGMYTWPFKHQYATHNMVIGGVLVLVGIAVYLKTTNKREVTSATVVAILGGMLVVNALATLG
ncbi:MAG: hypothetical protein WKG01_00505 [Kofleriaceae bacterium]